MSRKYPPIFKLLFANILDIIIQNSKSLLQKKTLIFLKTSL